MSTTSRLFAAAAASAMLAAGSGAAMAHGHGHRSFHSFHHRPHLQLYIGGGGGCGYYFERWQDSGSFFWKRKFYQCKGWW